MTAAATKQRLLHVAPNSNARKSNKISVSNSDNNSNDTISTGDGFLAASIQSPDRLVKAETTKAQSANLASSQTLCLPSPMEATLFQSNQNVAHNYSYNNNNDNFLVNQAMKRSKSPSLDDAAGGSSASQSNSNQAFFVYPCHSQSYRFNNHHQSGINNHQSKRHQSTQTDHRSTGRNRSSHHEFQHHQQQCLLGKHYMTSPQPIAYFSSDRYHTPSVKQSNESSGPKANNIRQSSASSAAYGPAPVKSHHGRFPSTGAPIGNREFNSIQLKSLRQTRGRTSTQQDAVSESVIKAEDFPDISCSASGTADSTPVQSRAFTGTPAFGIGTWQRPWNSVVKGNIGSSSNDLELQIPSHNRYRSKSFDQTKNCAQSTGGLVGKRVEDIEHSLSNLNLVDSGTILSARTQLRRSNYKLRPSNGGYHPSHHHQDGSPASGHCHLTILRRQSSKSNETHTVVGNNAKSCFDENTPDSAVSDINVGIRTPATPTENHVFYTNTNDRRIFAHKQYETEHHPHHESFNSSCPISGDLSMPMARRLSDPQSLNQLPPQRHDEELAVGDFIPENISFQPVKPDDSQVATRIPYYLNPTPVYPISSISYSHVSTSTSTDDPIVISISDDEDDFDFTETGKTAGCCGDHGLVLSETLPRRFST